MNEHIPKISVWTSCKNGGHFLRETLDSIFNQTFQDFEIVLVDGASTDDTIDILKSYKDPRLRWMTEPDNDPHEGFYKALMKTRGEYVMCMSISDGYVDMDWFRKCVDILDNDINISLVYGNIYDIDFNGKWLLGFPDWIKNPPPNGKDFFLFWLATRSFIPELTYCVRSKIYKKCSPVIKNVIFDYENYPKPMTDDHFETHNTLLKFKFNFIESGYLPKYLPVVASFGRYHKDSRNFKLDLYQEESGKKYADYISKLQKDFLSGKYVYYYRDGSSRVIGKINKNNLLISKKKIMMYKRSNRIFFNSNKKKHRFKTFIKNKASIKRMIKQSFIFRGLRFVKHYYKFMLLNDNRFNLSFNNCWPILNEWSNDHGFDRHYVYHTSWAARIIANNTPQLHIDIASDLRFSTLISAFTKVEYYDYRKLDLELDNLKIGVVDLLELPFKSNSIKSISCMHVIEHIGLGRYGDKIDPKGDIKAISELIRILAPGGKLFFVVPIGKSRIEFNAHRIYDKDQVITYFSILKLLDFTLIPDSGKDGGLVKNPPESLLSKQDTACGCFLFEK